MDLLLLPGASSTAIMCHTFNVLKNIDAYLGSVAVCLKSLCRGNESFRPSSSSTTSTIKAFATMSSSDNHHILFESEESTDLAYLPPLNRHWTRFPAKLPIQNLYDDSNSLEMARPAPPVAAGRGLDTKTFIISGPLMEQLLQTIHITTTRLTELELRMGCRMNTGVGQQGTLERVFLETEAQGATPDDNVGNRIVKKVVQEIGTIDYRLAKIAEMAADNCDRTRPPPLCKHQLDLGSYMLGNKFDFPQIALGLRLSTLEKIVAPIWTAYAHSIIPTSGAASTTASGSPPTNGRKPLTRAPAFDATMFEYLNEDIKRFFRQRASSQWDDAFIFHPAWVSALCSHEFGDARIATLEAIRARGYAVECKKRMSPMQKVNKMFKVHEKLRVVPQPDTVSEMPLPTSLTSSSGTASLNSMEEKAQQAQMAQQARRPPMGRRVIMTGTAGANCLLMARVPE
jgi:hypothetical protein